MAQPSGIAMFPFKNDYENDCLLRASTVNDVLLSAIRAFLVTRKGSRLGNMIGCSLPDLIYDLISFSNLTGLGSQIKSELSDQFPGVNFMSVNMSLDKSSGTVDLIVTITLSTSVTDITDLTVKIPTGQ